MSPYTASAALTAALLLAPLALIGLAARRTRKRHQAQTRAQLRRIERADRTREIIPTDRYGL
jgi:hypothetical protein